MTLNQGRPRSDNPDYNKQPPFSQHFVHCGVVENHEVVSQNDLVKTQQKLKEQLNLK